MSTEENKAIIRRVFEEVHNKGNFDVVDELFVSNWVHNGKMVGADYAKQGVSMERTAFPDLQVTIADEIAEGDLVVTRCIARGTHKGEFMGIPPTGKQVMFTGIFIHRIADGKIVEAWVNADQLGLLEQLGAISPPGQ